MTTENPEAMTGDDKKKLTAREAFEGWSEWRWCQAMDDLKPSHAAEVVCNRDGLEWFSCREHAPKGVKVVALGDWFARHSLENPSMNDEQANGCVATLTALEAINVLRSTSLILTRYALSSVVMEHYDTSELLRLAEVLKDIEPLLLKVAENE